MASDKIEELIQLKALLGFRIKKQKKILHKIMNGKWKFSSLEDHKLYALAKGDLKRLEAMREDVDKNIDEINVKKYIDFSPVE